MSTNSSRDRIRELIAVEDERLVRNIRFIEEGLLSGRISPESAEALAGLARRQHDANVRQLLGEEQA